MKFAGKYSLSFFIKYLLILIMILTAAAVVLMPKIVQMYLKLDYGLVSTGAREVLQSTPCIERARVILLVVLYPCAICAFFVENELRRMFRTLEDRDPFTERNVKSLNRMGMLMLVVFAMFVFKIITLNTIMTMLCTFAIILVALFCFILGDVFKQAVIYKQENDLTI